MLTSLEKDKPPVLGLVQRGGQVVLRMLADVQQKTIQPVIEAAVAKGTLIHSDEYDIYARLPAWGYRRKTVCHARGEYARNEDGDGFCEIHVNTMEATWSLLRSLRDNKLAVPSDVISPSWLSRSVPAKDLPR